MLVAIDVGNTETKVGCFALPGDTPMHTWRIRTQPLVTADEVRATLAQLLVSDGIEPKTIDAVVIASVVPKLDSTLADASRKLFGVTPRFFVANEQRLMPIHTERPGEVGADLVAAAVGGFTRYGGPLIVVSYGTATVFIAISAKGEYLGVAIAPGINISIDALFQRTAKLPQISLEAPQHAIGRNTTDALDAGIIFGYVGQTEALVSRMRAEMNVHARAVATGGLAEIIAKHTTAIDTVDPHLSLIGLALFHRNGL